MQRGCCFLRSTTTAGVALSVAMTLSASAWAISEQVTSARTVPDNDIVCHVAHLNARFDDKEGLFEGASQSGTLLILRNISARSCQVNAMPVVSFEGAGGQQLAVFRRVPRGMRQEPILSPVTVAAGAEVAVQLRWVAGDVFDGNNCVTPEKVVVTLLGGTLRLPFGRQMCAASGDTEFFSQAPVGPVTNEVQ
ncbi:DUF4232 domain-containing protein [Yersinia similis]|uniref:DUF4232 domain-containing protein n=1 Tax=Yersinia similis TaxID=367190 RepID=A0A0T9R8U5_9GAMM|nr:DUF4232 domain-containing protein [Yersinia similis]AHK19330.1 hypothetical protein BF17_08405 [Yersinia similis]CFQ63701.1 Uncharacterised protein [Yersinia similis]CNC56464.1 Uncharacterised protein [Yersinia similis]CNF49750.1 Uncharacterised protein [Yersinia similis]CNG35179.1 Uncharacterised protein [Yersinia similis]